MKYNILDEWRYALEEKGLRISSSKIKYTEYDFEGKEQVVNRMKRVMVRLICDAVNLIRSIKYLGSFI